ncbi:hypothetical protein [Spirosoma montaniterrae]|uniref:hypothetical protein n=1 Tax=Spirosoma montaniterrae TaxID=1178516 RepID=UPI0012F8DD50|nr:hypothetical protein [Spirosoma montaniterrae]
MAHGLYGWSGFDTDFCIFTHPLKTEPLVEVYQRTGTKWEYAFYTELSDSFTLHALGLTLSVAEVYEGMSIL